MLVFRDMLSSVPPLFSSGTRHLRMSLQPFVPSQLLISQICFLWSFVYHLLCIQTRRAGVAKVA